jgi:hypothetical protein
MSPFWQRAWPVLKIVLIGAFLLWLAAILAQLSSILLLAFIAVLAAGFFWDSRRRNR